MELDLRGVPKGEQFPRVLEAFDGLALDGSLVLSGDSDSRPIYEGLSAERGEVLAWSFLPSERGTWRARLSRLLPKDEEATVSHFFSRDHSEIDVLLHHLKRDLDSSAERGVPSREALRASFREFDARLERHIRWEEEILFPAVERQVPDLTEGPGRVMRAEHEEIRALKSNVEERFLAEDAPGSGMHEAARALDALMGILVEHNGKEEQVYYPMSDEIFSPREAGRLLSEVRSLK